MVSGDMGSGIAGEQLGWIPQRWFRGSHKADADIALGEHLVGLFGGGYDYCPLGRSPGDSPSTGPVFQGTSWATLAKICAFGLGWGIGTVLFGLGVNRLRMAVG